MGKTYPIPESSDLREVLVTDTAVVTALGENLPATWERLIAGKTAVRAITRFPVKNYCSTLAASIEDLDSCGEGSRIRPLLDRLLLQIASVPPDAALITASTKGGIDNLEKLERGEPSKAEDISLFAIPGIISERLGLIGEGFNISASCASSAIAIAQGAGLIGLGRADAVLICCIDLITEFTFSGFSSLKALSPNPCRPFDRERQGISLGEGAAALLLMSRERARQENRRCLGKVLGWGIAGDAVHITAPDKDGRGLAEAVLRALRMAGVETGEIAGISAHGTGTLYNDLMEVKIFRSLFGPRKVPVYSVKGGLGHSLGATGGIETALGLKALAMQTLPPTVGLVHPMQEAEGMVRAAPFSISGDYLLTTSSGFSGINAALVLGRECQE
ncbi:MAG: beta-ketoacyl-[acyl-carrier-protein] synthase family protein [Desulfobacteraceae bacterium]|nr:MAG: beta-ketoacyl-[acyl-carrier-protein] synthase family protein [Desulfobacteraceae bacterium]